MKKETRILVCVFVVNLRRTQHKTTLRIEVRLSINLHRRCHAFNTFCHSARRNNIDKGVVRVVLCQQHLARVFNVFFYSHCAFPQQRHQRNVQRATNASHAPRNVTASRPSNIRWSYVSATTIIGLITTCPSTTTGRSLVACIPVISNFPFRVSS